MTYWIKERHNPQLGVYYVACGKLTKKEAKRMENALYGDNYMLPFSCLAAYRTKIAELKASGKSVQLR